MMRGCKTILLTVIFFITGINLFAQTAEEWKELGNAEADSANYNKAIEYYQKAIETDSTYFDAYYNLGNTFSQIPDLDKAIEYYAKAIAINDTIADTFFALGGIYAEKEDYDKAIELFKKGINLKPDSPEEYYYLGLFYQEKGNPIYALLYAKKAAQLGDTLAQQIFISNEMLWEDNFVKPDYEQIKLDIEDDQSDFYYSKLWDRFQQGDSTMNLDEKRHLYYGYVFHKNYSPYASAYDAKQVDTILDKEEPSKEEWEKLVSLFDSALSVEPFNCTYLYYQSIAYDALNKSVDADKNINKIRCIADALTSTGDGLLKETAIHVIAVYSEYNYLFLNHLSMQSQSLANGGYDILYLKPNEDGLEELWFDVNQPLNHLDK
ncbi:MAG: DUF4919 domain-containing protein [Candidatus Azobacteroides sp.]|nr:DUF4919 domain-containing protein [Candidatus Azobacteroides sp.]